MPGSFTNWFKKLIKCYVDGNSTHPQIRKHKDPVLELHRLARAEKHRLAAIDYGGKLPPVWMGFIIQWLIWPVLSLRNAVREFLYPTKDFKRRWSHCIADLWTMWWLAMRYNLSPFHFYMYRLHHNGWSKGKEPFLLTAWEFNCIGRRMTRMRGNDVGLLDNKDRFFNFCIENQLQTVPVIDLNDPVAVEGMEARDLFVKTVLGHSGLGIQILEFDHDSHKWALGSKSLERTELKAALDECYGDEPYIVCYRCKNHDEIKWMSDKVLTTMRILTAWNNEGEVDLLRVTLRVPSTPEAVIDNSSQGGLSMPIDPMTGEVIGTAKSWKKDFVTDTMPGSERRLVGSRLPLWGELRDLVCRAHKAAGNYNFLGWDVAIAEEGVLLTECNVWSDIELVQAPQRRPFLVDDVLPYFLLEKCLWQDENGK
ncbi:MAG: sugar-transfer associated ATP-grasp domain-containing protein [Puniceicoccaceae bacterium]